MRSHCYRFLVRAKRWGGGPPTRCAARAARREAVEGADACSMMRWGLVPGCAKDDKSGFKMINAKAETVAEKPSFRSVFRARPCLVPADGFYEWKKIDADKQPYFITTRNKAPFAFAGLWE